MAPSQAPPDPCVYCGIDKTRARCAHQTQPMFDALAQICRALEGFGAEDQRRILKACRILAAPVPPPLVFGPITPSERPPMVDPNGRTRITFADFASAVAVPRGATAEQRLDAKLALHRPGDAMNLAPDEADVLRERKIDPAVLAARVDARIDFAKAVETLSADHSGGLGALREPSHGAGTARPIGGKFAVRSENEITYVMPHPDTIEWSTAPFTAEEGAAAEKFGFRFELHRPEVRAKARRAIAMQAYRGAENFARCRRQCPHGDRCTREDGHKEDADTTSTMYPPRQGCTLASCVCGEPTVIRHAVGCNEALCLGCGDTESERAPAPLEHAMRVTSESYVKVGEAARGLHAAEARAHVHSRAAFECITCRLQFCTSCRERVDEHREEVKSLAFTCAACEALHVAPTFLCNVSDCLRCIGSRPVQANPDDDIPF